jgi:hypothetical protein
MKSSKKNRNPSCFHLYCELCRVVSVPWISISSSFSPLMGSVSGSLCVAVPTILIRWQDVGSRGNIGSLGLEQKQVGLSGRQIVWNRAKVTSPRATPTCCSQPYTPYSVVPVTTHHRGLTRLPFESVFFSCCCSFIRFEIIPGLNWRIIFAYQNKSFATTGIWNVQWYSDFI